MSDRIVSDRTNAVTQRSANATAPVSPSPAAARLGRPRWLDTRLVLGVLLVLGSVALGSRVIAQADDTVSRWAASADLAPGTSLSADDLVPRSVRLPGELEDAYIAGAVPEGYVLTRPVGAGELVPRAAVAPASRVTALRYVTVAIPEAEAPVGLRAGSVVDVWITPDTNQADAADRPAELLLRGVSVESAGSAGGGLGVSGSERPVVLAVPQERRADSDAEEVLARLITAGRTQRVYLSLVPAGQG